MIRKVHELSFRGDPADIAELMHRFEERTEDLWRLDRAGGEQRSNATAPRRGMGAAWLDSYCFHRSEGAGLPAAWLWLHRDAFAGFAVSNVMAEERVFLSDEQYDAILAEFEAEVLRTMARDLKVEIQKKPPIVGVEERLPFNVLDALKTFSETANRSGLRGSDWVKWDRFLIQVHFHGPVLDGPDLDWWLERQGWPVERRGELIESYGRSLSLLAEYDEERVPS